MKPCDVLAFLRENETSYLDDLRTFDDELRWATGDSDELPIP